MYESDRFRPVDNAILVQLNLQGIGIGVLYQRVFLEDPIAIHGVYYEHVASECVVGEAPLPPCGECVVLAKLSFNALKVVCLEAHPVADYLLFGRPAYFIARLVDKGVHVRF